MCRILRHIFLFYFLFLGCSFLAQSNTPEPVQFEITYVYSHSSVSVKNDITHSRNYDLLHCRNRKGVEDSSSRFSLLLKNVKKPIILKDNARVLSYFIWSFIISLEGNLYLPPQHSTSSPLRAPPTC